MNTPTVSTLHIRWDDGALAASADQAPVLIGRGTDAVVNIEDRSVSRAHLRVYADNGGWVAVDESSRGTFDAAGNPIERVVVGEVETTLHLGAPAGLALRLVAVTPPVEQVPVVPAPQADVASPHAPPESEPPQHAPPQPVPGAPVPEAQAPPPPQAPYVPPIDTGEAWTVATFDTTLRLEVDGNKHAFAPPGRVVVGRDAGCDVVCDNDLVSRQHLAFTSTGEGSDWMMEDLGSSRGTFVDGKRLNKPAPAQGAFVAVLGDEDAGERVQVVTAGTHRKPRDRSKLLLALSVLVVGALISVGAALAFRDGGSDGSANTAEQITAAKKSTVLILAGDEEGNLTGGSGSGAFVSPDLILTNAHVADLGEAFVIGTTGVEDEPVLPVLVATEVARHDYLDLALLRVDEAASELVQVVAESTGELESANFNPSPLPLGNSTELSIGDELISLGFPVLTSSASVNALGEAVLPVATVAAGEINGLLPWPSCESGLETLAGTGACSSDGDLPRGNMLSDEFSGSGGSGGPVVVGGKLVAVRYGVIVASRLPEEISVTGGLAASMPIEYFEDWLADEISGR